MSPTTLIPRRRRPPPIPTMQDVHWPAPMGGLNTVEAGSRVPPSDCISLFNVVASDNGLRVRSGSQEWVTGLDGEVRSILAFNGLTAGSDRLFATTTSGIWDVSASTQTPTRVVTFPTASAVSGYGIFYTYTTSAGHFLLYTDEQNGYYLYTSANTYWQKVVSASQTPWAPLTNYAAGVYVLNGGNVYLCTQTGTSAGAGGPTGTGQGIVDGTCLWNFNYSISAAVGSIDPANFAFVTVWKNRAWFVPKGTNQAWFLGLNAIAGTATQLGVGQQSKHGGFLVGLWNWSLDGGQGIDDYLAMVFSGGDVAIYKGTDPTVVGAFGLQGVWYLGGIPSGRKIAVEYGGDVLVLGAVGIVPLSKLVLGNVVFDRSQYFTAKVSTLFNFYFYSFRTNPGWSISLHPLDNSIIVNVPTAPGQAAQPATQLVMMLPTRAWGLFQNYPMWSGWAWNGTYYFGTSDGRVLQSFGYVDGVTLVNPNQSSPIQWSLMTGFNNLGNAKKKQVHFIRPILTSAVGKPNYQAVARFDFDVRAQAALPGVGAPTGNTWDVALWDSGVWQGDFVTSQNIFGGAGIGANVAVAIRGSANGKTVLIGFDVAFDESGFM